MEAHDGSEAQAREGPSEALTQQVLESFSDASNPRLAEVMRALVSHLHEFAREVSLSESEWEAAIQFLTRAGNITTDERQEFILLSDVLGLSMLTVGIDRPSRPDVTDSTVFGPFFVEGSPEIPLGGDAAQGAPGSPCWVEGSVRDEDGGPVPGARIEIWEADENGLYDVQYEDDRTAGRAHMFTDDHGRYCFWSVLPAPYPIPHDGPVGELLEASGRSPMRPAHLHFMVTAPGYQDLITHIFVAGSPHLDRDAVFGVKPSLIVNFIERSPGEGPEGRKLEEPWYRAEFDIVLAKEEDDA